MSRAIHKLNALSVKNLAQPGRHADGNGLYLNVSKKGSKSWVLLYRRNGRRREMGLGSTKVVPLAEARRKALEAHQSLAQDSDPIELKAKTKIKTFGECADVYVSSMERQWKNSKHRQQWRMTLNTHASKLTDLPVSQVDTHAVVSVLKPIWESRPETAYRLMGRIERVLSSAKSQGLVSGDNPARWKGHLEHILPSRHKLSRGHHKALPYRKIPDFLIKLRQRSGAAALALEFTILTAARSGEVRAMEWSELNLEEAVWTIPAAKMKAQREHRVPLGKRAIELLKMTAEWGDNGFVFPGPKAGKPLSENSMLALLKRMGVPVTVHGFRSTFRDWAAEETNYSNHVCEMALAHTIQSETEKAYRRGDLFAKRIQLMNSWNDFCLKRAFNEQH